MIQHGAQRTPAGRQPPRRSRGWHRRGREPPYRKGIRSSPSGATPSKSQPRHRYSVATDVFSICYRILPVPLRCTEADICRPQEACPSFRKYWTPTNIRCVARKGLLRVLSRIRGAPLRSAPSLCQPTEPRCVSARPGCIASSMLSRYRLCRLFVSPMGLI